MMKVEAVKQVKLQESSSMRSLQVETHARVEFQDLTSVIQKLVEESRVESGLCHVFVPHTTAALLINENDDRALHKDLDNFLKELAPRDREYLHNDGNCDAHLKASLIGCSKTLFIENGRLVLGQWQGIYFCEFDGPRRRNLKVKVVSD
jgi:secondary thiamine-phosphate synthase enzyme